MSVENAVFHILRKRGRGGRLSQGKRGGNGGTIHIFIIKGKKGKKEIKPRSLNLNNKRGLKKGSLG